MLQIMRLTRCLLRYQGTCSLKMLVIQKRQLESYTLFLHCLLKLVNDNYGGCETVSMYVQRGLVRWYVHIYMDI